MRHDWNHDFVSAQGPFGLGLTDRATAPRPPVYSAPLPARKAGSVGRILWKRDQERELRQREAAARQPENEARRRRSGT